MIKRAIDFLMALLGLVLLSPLMLACAFAVRWEDGLPVIYRQQRIGRGGKSFWIYKFRSMRIDAEKDGPTMLEERSDGRLTQVGRFLRDRHLDELPQLWNVLRGDMALVGPRPERAFFISKIMEHDHRYERLYALRPGVTSYATLHNGYTYTMEKMLRRLDMDIYYLEHHTLWIDAKILAATFWNVVRGRKF